MKVTDSIRNHAGGYIQALEDLQAHLINESVTGSDCDDAELLAHIRTVHDMKQLVREVAGETEKHPDAG